MIHTKMMLKHAAVIVEVEEPFAVSDERQDALLIEACESVVASINRHVDGISRVYVDQKWVDTCPFCYREFETEASGKPLCCSRAVKEWMSERVTADQEQNESAPVDMQKTPIPAEGPR